jgi:hypothetical protein
MRLASGAGPRPHRRQQRFLDLDLTRNVQSRAEVRGENGTIKDMMRIMEDANAYKDVLAALPPTHREFFEKDFLPKDSIYKETKQQIRTRLHAVLRNPTMERIFTAKENKIDFFTEMNRGSIILVDTAKGFLKSEGSSAFGRMVLSLVFQSVLERSAPGAKRHPAFVFVDEAQEFMDESTAEFLREARKFNCGLVLSHQDMSMVGTELKAALASSTGIKFASRLSVTEAKFMAGEMRTTDQFINSHPKLSFAAFIRDVTPSAVTIPVEIVRDIDRHSPAAVERLRVRNRQRVSAEDGTSPTESVPRQPPTETVAAREACVTQRVPEVQISPQSKNRDFSDDWYNNSQ